MPDQTGTRNTTPIKAVSKNKGTATIMADEITGGKPDDNKGKVESEILEKAAEIGAIQVSGGEETKTSPQPPAPSQPALIKEEVIVPKKHELSKKAHLPTRYFIPEMTTIVLLAVVFSRPYLVREAIDWAINAAIWIEIILILLGYLAYKNAAFLKSKLPDEKSDFFFVKFRSWKMYLAIAILFIALAGIMLGGSIWMTGTA